jgi:hypothetical protein
MTFDANFFAQYQEMQASIQKLNQVYASFRNSTPNYFHTPEHEAKVGQKFAEMVAANQASDLTADVITQIVNELSAKGEIQLVDPRLFGATAAPFVPEPEPVRPNKADYQDADVLVGGRRLTDHGKLARLQAQFEKDMRQYEIDHKNWEERVAIMRQRYDQQQRASASAIPEIPLSLMNSEDELKVLRQIVYPEKIRWYRQNVAAIKAKQAQGRI